MAICERIAACRAAQPIGRGTVTVGGPAAMRWVVLPFAAARAIASERIHLIASTLSTITKSTTVAQSTAIT